jgi:hypothetical protein
MMETYTPFERKLSKLRKEHLFHILTSVLSEEELVKKITTNVEHNRKDSKNGTCFCYTCITIGRLLDIPKGGR